MKEDSWWNFALWFQREYLKVLNGSHKTVKYISRIKYIRTMTASANMQSYPQMMSLLRPPETL